MLPYEHYETRFTHTTIYGSRWTAYSFGADIGASPIDLLVAAVRMSYLREAGRPGSSQAGWYSIAPASLERLRFPLARSSLYEVLKHPALEHHFIRHLGHRHAVALNPLLYCYGACPDEEYQRVCASASHVIPVHEMQSKAMSEVVAFVALGRADKEAKIKRMFACSDRAAHFASLAGTHTMEALAADGWKRLNQCYAEALGRDLTTRQDARKRVYAKRRVALKALEADSLLQETV